MSDHPEIERSADMGGGASIGGEASGPRVVPKEGVAYVEGCDVPIWRLEMVRRAGRNPASLMKVFPTLTPAALDLAAAYARQHREEIEAMIRERGPVAVPLEDEGDDDEAAIRDDLDEVFEEFGEVFRRLAQ